MMSCKKKRAIKCYIVALICTLIEFFFAWNMPTSLKNTELASYIVLLVAMMLYAVIVMMAIIKHDIDIFEPIALVSLLYFAIMLFAPLLCLVRQDTALFGVEVFGGCIKGTCIFLLSYISFALMYYRSRKEVSVNYKLLQIEKRTNLIVVVMLTLWFVCLFITLIYDISIGRSPLYLLSFGRFGVVSNEMSESSLQIFINFSYCTLGCWMYLERYWNKRALVWLLYIITLSLFITRGFRFIVVIALIAPIVRHFIKIKKRPSIIIVGAFLLVLLVALGIFGNIRNSLRTGQEITNTTTAIEALDDIFNSDFTIFKSYYAIVEACPEKVDYQYGKEIFLYTATMIIPRALWPGKPLPVYRDVLSSAVNSYAVSAGVAFPNIGEYYFEFGIFGCVVLMGIFGFLCGKLRNNINNTTETGMITYSILLMALIQVVARGYTPSVFYLLLFLSLPQIIIYGMNYIALRN